MGEIGRCKYTQVGEPVEVEMFCPVNLSFLCVSLCRCWRMFFFLLF